MRLKDQVVLITGGSRGVGAACAVACAREGADVAVAGKSLDEHPTLPGTLLETVAQVEACGRRGLAIQTDVRFEEQVEAMVARTVETFGRLDVLINNAGAIHLGPVADWPAKRFDLVTQINVRAAFLASKAAIPHLRQQGGHIVMMSPPVNAKAAPHKGPYLSSKIGMTVVGQAIDAEEERIAVHALWPVTGIKTAATMVFGLGQEAQWRTPAILADATVALIAQDPAQCSFRAWLDEEVLQELLGLDDLTGYRCVADSEPSPMSITLVDPDWTPGPSRPKA